MNWALFIPSLISAKKRGMLLLMYFRLLQAVLNQSRNLCYRVLYLRFLSVFARQFSIIV